jgi:mRNA interferase MazF
LTEFATAPNGDRVWPRRGEVWLASLGAARAGELGKSRPAVVLSADAVTARSDRDLTVIVPLSGSREVSALRPAVSTSEGVDAPSVAVCRAIRGVSPRRLLRRLGRANANTLAAVERVLGMLLGLD